MANPNYIFTGKPTVTARYVVTDVAQQFAAAVRIPDKHHTVGVLITCEDNNVRFCLGGSTPTEGAAGLGHILYVGQSIKLANSYAISTFSYINAVAQSAGVLQVTFEFELGA